MTDGTWIRVASMSDVEPGGAKAVRLGEGGFIKTWEAWPEVLE